MQKQTNKDLSFFYTEGKPQSLVMLTNFEKILPKMFKSAETEYIWVDQHQNKSLRTKIEKQLEISINYFQNLDQSIKFLEGKAQNILDYYLYICPRSMMDSVKIILTRNYIKGAIFFTLNREEEDSTTSSTDSESEGEKVGQQNFHKKQIRTPRNYKQLVMQIKRQLKNELKSIQLLNFIPLSSDPWQSHLLVTTMMTMINQKLDKKNREKLVEQMRLAMEQIAVGNAEMGKQMHKVKQFFEELKRKPLEATKAIGWYTAETPIFRFLNHLLRSARHPGQLYWILPYFNDLFQDVQQVWKLNYANKPFHKLVVYRGGFISKDELNTLKNNVQNIVQNLGFLSTSQQQDTALNFMKNVIFEISVNFNNYEQKNCNGYANTKPMSKFSGESEILFNPLNFFKVIQIEPSIVGGREVHRIKLELQFFPQILKQESEQLSTSQKYLRNVRFYQIQQKNKMCQGNALVRQGESLQYSIEYWAKYCELCTNYEKKLNGLWHLTAAVANLRCQKEGLWLCMEQLKIIFQYVDPNNEKLEYINELLQNTKQLKMKQIFNGILEIVKIFDKNQLGQKNADYSETLKQIVIITINNKFALQQSLVLLQKSALIKQRIFTQNSRQYLNILQWLGKICKMMDKNELSNKYFKKCFKIREKVINDHHPEYANSLDIQGDFEAQKGNYHEALRLKQRCLQIQEKVSGKNNPKYIVALVQIGCLHQKFGVYPKALQFLNQAKDIYTKILGPKHPNTVKVQCHLCRTYCSMGDYKKSLKMFYQCLEIKKEVFGEEHMQCGISLENIGRIHIACKQPFLAIQALKSCLQMWKVQYGIKHLRYNVTLTNLALAYQKSGNLSKAIKLYEEARKVMKKQYSSSSEYGSLLYYIGTWFHHQRDYQKASQYYEVAKNIITISKVNLIDSQFFNIMADIGCLYEDTAEFEKNPSYYDLALKQYEKLRKLKIKYFPENSIQVIQVDKKLAALYKKKKQYQKSLNLYDNCLKIIGQNKGEETEIFAEILKQKADIFITQGRIKEALQMHIKCAKIRNIFGQNKPDYILSLTCIANCYKIIGNYQKALLYLKKSSQLIKILQPHEVNIEIYNLQRKAQILSVQAEYRKANKIYVKICQMLNQSPLTSHKNCNFYFKKLSKAKVAYNISQQQTDSCQNYIDLC